MYFKKFLKISIGAFAGVLLMAINSANAFTACQVTDVGGVDDKSFNQTAWKGVQDAVAKHGIDSKLLESKAETDYEPHLNSMVSAGCDVIIAVGFLMGEATEKAALANPNSNFTIVDFAYTETKPNLLGQVYR